MSHGERGKEGDKQRKKERKKRSGRRKQKERERGVEGGRKEERINQQPTNQPTVVTWQSGFSQTQKMILLKELHKPAAQEEVNNKCVKVKVSL